MFETVNITIGPNAKYERVIGVMGREHADDVPETGDHEDWPDEHKEAADDYIETVENAPEPEDHGTDPDDVKTLTWGTMSPPDDADLVAKIATYFDGMEPDEPTELLRAKCRLLDVDVYAQAQIAARQELRD